MSVESPVSSRPTVNMAAAMPLTSEWINGRRAVWGRKYVNDLIRAAMQGERNCFYAIENGHILGEPFDWSMQDAAAISMGAITGAKYIAALRDPKDGRSVVAARDAAIGEVANGAH